jgi:hypothetical protein
MYLCHGPFQWPCRWTDGILSELPNMTSQGLPLMPLDAAIGQVFALYCPPANAMVINFGVKVEVVAL